MISPTNFKTTPAAGWKIEHRCIRKKTYCKKYHLHKQYFWNNNFTNNIFGWVYSQTIITFGALWLIWSGDFIASGAAMSDGDDFQNFKLVRSAKVAWFLRRYGQRSLIFTPIMSERGESPPLSTTSATTSGSAKTKKPKIEWKVFNSEGEKGFQWEAFHHSL